MYWLTDERNIKRDRNVNKADGEEKLLINDRRNERPCRAK